MLKKLKSTALIKHTATYFISNVINAAIPLILLPVLTRYLTPAEYGEVGMFQTLLIALGVFTGVGVVGASGRKYYDENVTNQEIKLFVATCMQVLLFCSFIVFLFMYLLREQFSVWLGIDTKWILLAVLLSALSMIIRIRLEQWQIRQQSRMYGALQISQSLLNMMLSLFLVVALLQGVNGRILAQGVAILLTSISALFLLKRDGLLCIFVWKPKFIIEIFSFGFPLIPHVAGYFLLTSFDRYVITNELGLAETGVYMVAVQMTAAMALLFDAINNAYVPWLFDRLKRDCLSEKRQIVRYTYIWFFIIIMGAGTVFAFGSVFVVWIAGQKYAQASEVIGWLALGQGFGGMYLMVTNYIFYSKRTGMLSVATISSGLINIALLYILVRNYGIKGAAIAFCMSMLIRFLLVWWIANRQHPMPWFTLFK